MEKDVGCSLQNMTVAMPNATRRSGCRIRQIPKSHRSALRFEAQLFGACASLSSPNVALTETYGDYGMLADAKSKYYLKLKLRVEVFLLGRNRHYRLGKHAEL